MTKKAAKCTSGNGQLTKIELSAALRRKIYFGQRKSGNIIMNLKAIREMSTEKLNGEERKAL